jgi:hypothetical protein
MPAGAHHAPQFAHLPGHVGDEEDREDANDGVETAVRKPEARHVAGLKPDVAEAASFGLTPGDREQPFREVNAEDLPLRPDPLGGRKRRSAAAAADIEDVHARHQPGELDRAPPGPLPEAERRVVEMVGGGVVGARRLQFCRVRLHERRTVRPV